MDRLRLETFREQSARQVLPAHRRRAKTTCLRKIPLGSNLRGCSGRSPCVETENRAMNLKFWRKRTRHSDLDKETRSHWQHAPPQRIERGEPTGQAAAASRREFGN